MNDQFEFRTIRQEEALQAAELERICFPPNEACKESDMIARVAAASDLFLVAVDIKTEKIAGFLNGLSTDEKVFRDEFFTDASLCHPQGANIMLLGFVVRPEFRRQGLAAKLMRRYIAREAARGRKKLLLTCLEEKTGMYRKMGFQDNGICASTWGGEAWHEMVYDLLQ